MTGSSTQGITTVLHPVADLATAKALHAARLGVPPQTDESYYVGFEAAGATVMEPAHVDPDGSVLGLLQDQ